MAFQDLTGANCAGANPLRNLANHFGGDKSLQREAIRPELAGDLRRERFAPQDDAFAREFFERADGASSAGAAAMRRDPGPLAGMRLHDMARPPPGDWVSEFERVSLAGGPPPQDFAEFEQIYRNLPPPPAADAGAAWARDFHADPRNFQPLSDAEFNEFEKYYHARAAPKITEIPPEQWADEFAGTSATAASSTATKEDQAATASQWADEMSAAQMDAALDESNDLFRDEDLEEYLRQAQDEWPDSDNFLFSPKRVPETPYEFESVNAFLDHPNPYEEGIKFSNTGNLSDAALAFEAAVQRDPDNAEAWFMLGSVQAENEKESAAIAALQQAVKLDPSHLNAALALAISYTNEGAEAQALDVLSAWIRTKYPKTPAIQPDRLHYHQQVVDQYLQVVRESREIDPDVQVGLGVLFNLSADYAKAVDCFRAALSLRPDDYLLWNRLGATLANGGKSEEAIEAYHRALELKPSFVRARYNLGVSCINIGCFQEAAEHFLGALALHGGGNQRNVSNNLWETLRRTFIMMDRRDLLPLTYKHDVNLFRGEFEF